jgi:hypothetical protein
VPYKTIADTLATRDSIKFLSQLQAAVASSYPPTLTKAQQALSDRFNSLFGTKHRNDAAFIAGTRTAHELILNCYLQATGKTDWITFTNIGTTWTALQRSAISEFIQYANALDTAAYFQTFKDGNGNGNGNALDGAKHSYVLTFGKRETPQAKRFWSVTAYIPGSKGVPQPNWLPVPRGGFNLMLRVYGPEGKVASDTYVPPAARILR